MFGWLPQLSKHQLDMSYAVRLFFWCFMRLLVLYTSYRTYYALRATDKKIVANSYPICYRYLYCHAHKNAAYVNFVKEWNFFAPDLYKLKSRSEHIEILMFHTISFIDCFLIFLCFLLI